MPFRPILSVCTAIFSLIMVSLTIATQSAYAADLLETYDYARLNDPEWSAERSKYLAERESEKIGYAGLLPQVQFAASYSNTRYDLKTDDGPKFSDLLGVDINEAIDCLLLDTIAAATFVGTEITQSACEDLANHATDTSFAVSETKISVTQPLFRLDRWYSYKRSRAVADQGHAAYLKAEQDLILRVADIYFNTLKAWEQVEFARNEENALQRQLTATEQRYKKGLVSSIDVYEAQAISDLARSSRISAENLFRSAIEDLERITQKPGIAIIPLPSELPIEIPNPDNPEIWVEAAKQNNLDLTVARFAAAVTRQNHRAERSHHAPTVDLVASYSQQDANGRTSAFEQGRTNSSSIAVSMNLPLYTGGALTARERKAKFQMREAEYRVQQVLLEVASSTRRLYRNIIVAVDKIQALEVAIESNTKALKAVEKGYRSGTRNAAEMLQATRDLFKAQTDHADARYDYILYTLRLKQIVGVLAEEDLGNLNAWLVDDQGSINFPATFTPNVDASTSPLLDARDTYKLLKAPEEDKHYPIRQQLHDPEDEQPKGNLLKTMKGWILKDEE